MPDWTRQKVSGYHGEEWTDERGRTHTHSCMPGRIPEPSGHHHRPPPGSKGFNPKLEDGEINCEIS